MKTQDKPEIDAEYDEYFESWLFGCHVCRREGFTWLFGRYENWTQRQAYVQMIWHREAQHQDLDESGRFALPIGFNHEVFPEVELP